MIRTSDPRFMRHDPQLIKLPFEDHIILVESPIIRENVLFFCWY